MGTGDAALYAKIKGMIDAGLAGLQRFAARRIGTTPEMAEIRRMVYEGKTAEARRLITRHLKKESGK